MTTDWIMTASGRAFYPLEPRVHDVSIADIAHALAAVNRFNGHTSTPYSVAQHSVLVSRQLDDYGAAIALVGLLHDASEAYLGDIPRPLKKAPAFAPYREAEARLQAVIWSYFTLTDVAGQADVQALIKQVDRRMLRTEQQQLMPPAAHGEDRADVLPFKINCGPWPFMKAQTLFLERYRQLRRVLKETRGAA
jgi:hypothetical protein